MDLPWLDLPFTFLTLLLATRLAYDYYGDVAAAFAGGFSIQVFLFYCFARWYRHAIAGRAVADAAGGRDDPSPSARGPQQGDADADDPPVLTPLLGSPHGVRASTLANRCFAVVFMVFVPLVIVVFERSQADVVAYALCLANIIVMVIWLSPDSGTTVTAAKSFLRLSDDEDEGSGGSAGADNKCCVCLAGMREDQVLRALPRCGHTFHDKCIGKWLKAHPTCPVCRATAVPPPLDSGGSDPLDDDISPV
ncbi:E3 ubiquitin-protein ligase [Dichanthelium oligosanthes]|uniref:RING-type E3 ubiquitin transferase n=1 Tax=Dichanthelium oligosanthes TaxID=888268 RepID=A0A1E5VHG4_9POAL|nr:E3 ubiquitin-protein ligase [Dichanthelium oligosanthes]